LDGHIPFDINPKNGMIPRISPRAFWALKVFALKSKLFVLSEAATKVHSPEQGQNWLKVIGMMEPIFAGGWL
jgi:hypothetical protein